MWNLLTPLVGPIINKVVDLIPDKNARAKAKEQFEKELLSAVTSASNAQSEINKAQANHKSIFVAGARPFLMWVCGAGMLFQYILHPMLVWIWSFCDLQGLPPPPMDMATLSPMLLGMLGLGTMRSFDKLKGTQTDRISA